MASSVQSLPVEEVWRPTINPWWIAGTVMLATFMEVLDTSIANVSLPHIAGSLSAGIDESTWVLTSYLVSNAIVLPLTGWLSRIFGRKRFYIACVLTFVVSSLFLTARGADSRSGPRSRCRRSPSRNPFCARFGTWRRAGS